MMNIYSYLKKIAFLADPEKAHVLAMKMAKSFPQSSKSFISQFEHDKYSVETAHLKVNFPLGLAAGLDKNAEAIDFFTGLQFGFIEVGTVTPRPQIGNPKPRLFRLIEQESILNRMGFNNLGMDEVYHNILRAKSANTLGVNLGKNKDTPADKAIEDYLSLFNKFKDIANYLVINISSPNTVGLRDLQNESFLNELMLEINRIGNRPPVFLKLAPDLDNTSLKNLIDQAMKTQFNGLIATNTCLRPDIGQGGVSGRLLSQRASEVRKLCLEQIKGNEEFDFIGVGGISSFEDIWEYWQQGGKLAQVYSSLIYQGPKLLESIKAGIDKKLNEHNLKNVSEIFENIKEL